MSGHLARLGRQTLVYGLSGVAVQFFGVVTVPVMARQFTTAQYGILELVTAGISVAAVLADLGLASASQRSYYDYTDGQSDERRTVLSTTSITYMATALPLMALLIVLRDPLSRLLFNDSQYSDLIVIAAASLPITLLMNFGREVMRLHFRGWQFLASSLISAAGGAAFILIALLVFHMGLEGALLGGVIGSAIAGIYGLVVVRRDIGRRFSPRELRTMLDYGLPLVPTALALWALALVDRFMVSNLANLSEVGEYAMANRLGVVLTLAATAFATAFAPFMLSLHAEDPEAEKVIRAQAFAAAGLVLAVVALVVSLFAREILELVAPRFDTAYEAVGLLAFGLAAYGISNVVLGGISLARKTRSLVVYSGIAAAVNIGLNFVVIPAWGMVGAAFSTAVAYVLLLVLYYGKAQQVYPTPYNIPRFFRLAVLTGLASAVGAIPIDPVGVALAVKAGVAIAFLAALRLTGVIAAEDLQVLRLAIRERRPR